jgi:hypothetical protein
MKNEWILCFMKPMRKRLSLIHSFIHRGLVLLLGFSHVPNVFPSCSQVVSPKMFPIAPHIYHPIRFCPKFNSHVCKLKSWVIGAIAHLFLFCNWRSKEMLRFGSAQCYQKNWWWANQYDSFNPKKKKRKICEYTHELINMNRRMLLTILKGQCMVKENSKFNLEKGSILNH